MKIQKKLILLCIVTVLFGVLFTGCGKKEINLNDYISVVFSGYEGYGIATVEFDYESFETDCEKIKIKNPNVAALYGNVAEYYQDFCFTYSVGEKEQLSNGDTITLTWECEESLAENNTSGILVYNDESYTVSGLDSLPTFDVFEGVEVIFSGYSPAVNIKIIENNEFFEYNVTAVNGESVNGVGNLALGDIVTITASSKRIEEFIDLNKMVPESETKNYEVTADGIHICKVSDITQEVFDEIHAESISTIENQWKKYYNNPGNYSAKHIGIIVAESEMIINRDLFFVYEVSSIDESEPIYYWGVKLVSAVINSDGTFDFQRSEIPEQSFFGYGGNVFKAANGLNYIGFETLDSFYQEFVVDSTFKSMDTNISELNK